MYVIFKSFEVCFYFVLIREFKKKGHFRSTFSIQNTVKVPIAFLYVLVFKGMFMCLNLVVPLYYL